MTKPSKYFFTLFFISYTAHSADLFQITNRDYGDAPDQTVIDAIDSLFDSLETSVNENLPDADTETFVQGIANSSVMASSATATDYTSSFSKGLLGMGFAVGANLGTNTVSSMFNGTIDPSKVGGLAADAGVFMGFNMGAAFKSKWGFIEPSKLRVFMSFAKYSTTIDVADISLTSFAALGKYRLVDEINLGGGVLKWNGVDVTSGLRIANMNISLTEEVDQSQDTTVPSLGGATLTANFDGTLNLGAESTTYTMPIEASTSARLLYFLNTFLGMGLDFSLGSATGITDVTGPITVSSSPAVLNGVSGQAALDLGNNKKPALANLRFFGGFGFDLYVANVQILLSKSVTNGSFGAGFSAKAFW